MSDKKNIRNTNPTNSTNNELKLTALEIHSVVLLTRCEIMDRKYELKPHEQWSIISAESKMGAFYNELMKEHNTKIVCIDRNQGTGEA